MAEQLSFESSRKIGGRSLTRTESILKTSEVRILDLDAQVRALKIVSSKRLSKHQRSNLVFALQENEKLKHENEELREHAVAA